MLGVIDAAGASVRTVGRRRDDYPGSVPEQTEALSALPGAGRSVRGRPRASNPTKIGLLLFAVGLLAVLVIMVLFATGSQDLPLWLNLAAMLAPVGFGVGLFGVFLEGRSRVVSARRRALPGRADTGAATGDLR
jgi:hypothetical protein